MEKGRPKPQGGQGQGWRQSQETLACLFQPHMVRQGPAKVTGPVRVRALDTQASTLAYGHEESDQGSKSLEGRGQHSGAKIEARRKNPSPVY